MGAGWFGNCRLWFWKLRRLKVKTKLFAAFLLGALLVQTGLAQNGYEKIMLIAKGSYTTISSTSVGTSGSVLIQNPNAKRVDLTCRNNSAFTLFIGTNAASTGLLNTGFPVLANEAFELGAFSDASYGIGSGGTVDVRCWEGAIR